MGAKDSKRSCLSYEDAVKRMSDAEFKRVCEAFKRLTGGNQLLNRHTFTHNVLGDGVPLTIADWLYTACGGGPRGIALKDLICGLVLLTRGTQDEKIRFLWTLYCNDSGTHITRNEFQNALQIEGTLPPPPPPPPDLNNKPNLFWDRTLISLFGINQDRVTFEHFKAWIQYNKDATILSKWLLSNPCVSLSSEVETPTFYQTLAGVTHLEEQDISELEKCFWQLQSNSQSGNLDFNCIKDMVCPPIPLSACEGLFLALDANRDGHVDFKELCCGISAACRGPKAERMKFCFKIFDMDRDCYLNQNELEHMIKTLLFIKNDTTTTIYNENVSNNKKLEFIECVDNINENELIKLSLNTLKQHLDNKNGLNQEEFLVWSVNDNNNLVGPLLELLFQVCHVSLGLKPYCRHHEHDIVSGWLEREERRGYHVGQFWYLISSEWWQQWSNYTTSTRTNLDYCDCRLQLLDTNRHTSQQQQQHNQQQLQVEEGIVCDESLISNCTDYTTTSSSNEYNSNSMESMGDLLTNNSTSRNGGDSCSIASSSGVSSSSGTILTTTTLTTKRLQGLPGPIDNNNLICNSDEFLNSNSKVITLTGEGGRLKRNQTLVQHIDFELIPDSLWKALSLWYGSSLPLPRQVIRPPDSTQVELELYPINLKILRHQNPQQQQQQQNNTTSSSWTSVVGGYGAAALSTAGLTTSSTSNKQQLLTTTTTTRRYLAYTAAFSRLANIRQIIEFLCLRLQLRYEDIRLWHIKDTLNTILLEDENITLQDLGIIDSDQILLEVRNKDLTWPEELGALLVSGITNNVTLNSERRPTICLPPGATGLHNLGNTCFMNAALQAVSNTRPLTLYFQRDGQLSELNCINPLGTKGLVAKRYAELCRELWTGSTRSVAPLKLRYCVTKHAPHLGGGGQHDSQELLAWLLDALHEDLNRVGRKQYTELKDSNGRSDEIVADEAWLSHLNRDHSIITDLFYGQLKSKVTCQTCGHESVRFDPFNLLSLPLPMESFTLCEVLVIRLNGETPTKYGLRLNSEAKYLELKEQLQFLCDIKTERLLLAELSYSQIRQILNDDIRINPQTATELYAYELPDSNLINLDNKNVLNNENDADLELNSTIDSPLARSPENTKKKNGDNLNVNNTNNGGMSFKKSSISIHSNCSNNLLYSDIPIKFPNYLIAVHRKSVRQETYFLSQQKSKPSLFGLPLLLGCCPTSTCQSLYETVWKQVTRLLSPLPQSDQTNHATDCDDSLGYEFPFTLKAVLQGGQICAICHWTQFCRGCTLPCSDDLVFNIVCNEAKNIMCIAIDWDPTALHLRYQSCREKLWLEDESIKNCRKLHTEPIDLDYCLKAFTSEERLEAKYHCSNCQDKQPATKKLQIWRLPPILIIHLKRFDYVNNKWVKTQKVVNFPFKNFDPTTYLASIPQETILRHKQLVEEKFKLQFNDLENSFNNSTIPETSSSNQTIEEEVNINNSLLLLNDEHSKLLSTSSTLTRTIDDDDDEKINNETHQTINDNSTTTTKINNKKCLNRKRLESTSLLKTPIIDENLKDYHQHKLLPGQDPFDLQYQLYAVVSHSGMLNGGHYISYACNPNGNWYCYNDSSCREVLTESTTTTTTTAAAAATTTTEEEEEKEEQSLNSNNSSNNKPNKINSGCTPLSRRKQIQQTLTTTTNNVDSNNTTTIIENDDIINDDHDDDDNNIIKCDDDSNKSDIKINSNNNNNNTKCSYSNVKIPKIDTSSAYILFYERSGLDYKPYLPDVITNSNNNNNNSQIVPENDLDVSESELRKQIMCSLQ